MKEVYKDVKGYEGSYMVSNLGNIKSLSKTLQNDRGYYKTKEIVLKQYYNNSGYKIVTFSNKCKRETRTVYSIVAESFLNHKRCNFLKVIDHIDNNKDNNKAENLRITTNRINTNRGMKIGESNYRGVSKKGKKWQARILTDGIRKCLGSYDTPELAGKAYNDFLNRHLNKSKQI